MEGSGDDVNDILQRYQISPNRYIELTRSPVFLKELQKYREDIRDNGLTFKVKARVMAEQLLPKTYSMIYDPDVAPTVQADLIKSVARWAGYDQPKLPNQQQDDKPGFSIVINLGEQTQVLSVDTVEVEQLEAPKN